MREWHRTRDLLRMIRENVIPETSTLEETIGLILAETQLLQVIQNSPSASPEPTG
jgi:hypothetical protein